MQYGSVLVLGLALNGATLRKDLYKAYNYPKLFAHSSQCVTRNDEQILIANFKTRRYERICEHPLLALTSLRWLHARHNCAYPIPWTNRHFTPLTAFFPVTVRLFRANFLRISPFVIARYSFVSDVTVCHELTDTVKCETECRLQHTGELYGPLDVLIEWRCQLLR